MQRKQYHDIFKKVKTALPGCNTCSGRSFITGEVSERTYYVAMESGIHFYSAGHHATERYGIQALGKHLADQFGVEHLYIDMDNPI